MYAKRGRVLLGSHLEVIGRSLLTSSWFSAHTDNRANFNWVLVGQKEDLEDFLQAEAGIQMRRWSEEGAIRNLRNCDLADTPNRFI